MGRISRKEKFSLLVKMHNTHTIVQTHHSDSKTHKKSRTTLLQGHGAKTQPIHHLRSEAKRQRVEGARVLKRITDNLGESEAP